MQDSEDLDERYKDLVAACWSIFPFEESAAARISILFEAYPDLAMKKLRDDPEFFGAIRDDKASLLQENDRALSTTALTIREKLLDWRNAIDSYAEAELEQNVEREQQRERRRRRDRER